VSSAIAITWQTLAAQLDLTPFLFRAMKASNNREGGRPSAVIVAACLQKLFRKIV
jgi:hypothetical protein